MKSGQDRASEGTYKGFVGTIAENWVQKNTRTECHHNFLH